MFAHSPKWEIFRIHVDRTRSEIFPISLPHKHSIDKTSSQQHCVILRSEDVLGAIIINMIQTIFARRIHY